MIKTFNINLAGQIFNINEDAYEHLSGYFNSLRAFYANEEDKDEIIRDIESRFAELFLAKGKNYIVTIEDTTEVVNLMGNPQEFDEENIQQSANTASNTTQTTIPSSGKRLYRDEDNSLVMGVCSGLSAYVGIKDPIWVRLLFILFTVFGAGTPIIIYIILSLIVPKAETSAQKLEMQGEEINLSNIEKKIKDETDNLNKKNPKGFFYNLLSLFVSVIGLLVKSLVFIFRFIGVIILSALLITLFTLIIAFVIVNVIGAPAASKYFFTSSYDFLWISFGGILVLTTVFVFFAVLLYSRIYKSEKPVFKRLVLPLFGFFMLGCLMLNIGGNTISKTLAEKKKINQTFPMNYGYKSDTLVLSMNPSVKDEDYDHVEINGVKDLMDFISEHEEKFFPVEIEIFQSESDSFYVVKEFSANGKTDKEALQNATTFSHNISQNNNRLIIDPYIQFNNDKVKYRNQKIKVKVYVPEGKVIRWDARTEKYMDLKKLNFNWDDIRGMVPPMPPAPPMPPMPSGTNQKIVITTNSNGASTTNISPSKITINIDPNKEDADQEIDKAQQQLEEAREKTESAKEETDNVQEEIQDSLDEVMDIRLHTQHYIFRMHNGELIPLD